jgi:hypothetical protein
MNTPDLNDAPPEETTGAERPLWLRLARIIVVLAIVILAVMAFGSWYFTNTFDFVFGPPR